MKIWLCFTLGFSLAVAEVPAELAQETTVSKIVVGLVQTKKLAPALSEKWKTRASRIQGKIVADLNEKSFLVVKKDAFNIPASGSPAEYARVAKRLEVDGILSFDAKETEILANLRSGLTGKVLSQWSFVYEEPLGETEEKVLITNIMNSLVADFPYVGYIKKISDSQVLINLGTKFQTQPGTILQVFEFDDDENPNFSSQKTVLGKVMVTKVAENGALAKIGRSSTTLHNFAKLEPYIRSQASTQQDFTYRQYENFWMSAGPQFTLMDTTGPNDSNSLSRRYRVTLTPFYKLAMGGGPFSIQASYGNNTYEKNEVNYLSLSLLYDIYFLDLGSKWKSFTALGATYSRYSAKAGPSNFVSSTNYSPYLDEGLFYQVSQSSRFFGGFQIHYPATSTDSVNGGSIPLTSFGMAGYGGLRVQVTPLLAFEGMILNKLTSWTFGNRNIQEILFTSSFSAIYLF